MKDKKWISVYKEQPKHNEIVSSRISYEEGYCSNTEYDAFSKTFKSFEDHRNRFVITIWKHDEWCRND